MQVTGWIRAGFSEIGKGALNLRGVQGTTCNILFGFLVCRSLLNVLELPF